MSNEKSGNQQNSFDTAYGRYLSERKHPIELETLDLDASTLDPEVPVGGPCVCSTAYKLFLTKNKRR